MTNDNERTLYQTAMRAMLFVFSEQNMTELFMMGPDKIPASVGKCGHPVSQNNAKFLSQISTCTYQQSTACILSVYRR